MERKLSGSAAGRVKAGDVVPKATIFIFTAGPKVGTSTFCPSCYADCRKSAKTDAQDEFRIESLDPQLIFRILVVAKGYKPKFVSKVDPAAGPLEVDLEPVETRDVTPGKSIRGRVVDPADKPVVGAVVEAHGIRKKNDAGSMRGQLPGVDPLAVTDEAGEFLLTSQDSFESLDVRVEARAFAHKQFTKLASGTVQHTLALAEGATVTGRVLWDGRIESMSQRIESGVTRANRLAAVRERKLPTCDGSCGLTWGNSQRSSRGNGLGMLGIALQYWLAARASLEG